MLQEVLSRRPYGIMVYQEQVMQIAQQMGGYSLGAADLLRRAMGKKIRAEMERAAGGVHHAVQPRAASLPPRPRKCST